jgi:hypothetical protein
MTGRRNSILTEKHGRADLARQFFDEVLVPLARSSGKGPFFPLGTEPAAESYFTEPARRVMTPADFVLPAAESPADFVNELMGLWIEQGDEELTAMRAALADLAAAMTARVEESEVEADPPAFIYAMF